MAHPNVTPSQSSLSPFDLAEAYRLLVLDHVRLVNAVDFAISQCEADNSTGAYRTLVEAFFTRDGEVH